MLFSEIIGQDEIKRRLIHTVLEGRVSHAQLFTGPEGSRKLALAIAYAQFINCRNRQNVDPETGLPGDSCGTCPSCIKYEKLAHPDLHFIYPIASTKDVKNPMSRDFLKSWRQSLLENDFRLTLFDWYEAIGIEKKQGIINADDCSEILRTLSYKSYESEYKVMILWMVEKLYHSAAPKILKILEEPPDKTLFILITENQDQIINTILSRSQIVRIPRLSDQDVTASLQKLCPDPGTDIERVVPLAEGNLTRACKMLRKDEDESFMVENYIKWMRLCYANKIQETLEFVTEISRIGRERQKAFLGYSARIIRHGMLLHYTLPQLTRLNKEEKDFLVKFSRAITNVNILQMASALEDAQYHIERNANASILFMDLSFTMTSLLYLALPLKKS
jgi:DNA polymerase III subunit delta'